jgi:hypothetical protein
LTPAVTRNMLATMDEKAIRRAASVTLVSPVHDQFGKFNARSIAWKRGSLRGGLRSVSN